MYISVTVLHLDTLLLSFVLGFRSGWLDFFFVSVWYSTKFCVPPLCMNVVSGEYVCGQ